MAQDKIKIVYNPLTDQFDSVQDVSDLVDTEQLDSLLTLPVGGDEYSLLEKISVTDGDADWTDPIIYSGYSARYTSNIDIQGVKAALDYIFNMQYAAPTITATATGSGTLREKGAVVSSVTLGGAITKRSNPITEVRYYLNPSTLLNTYTSGGGIPNGGTLTGYTYNTPFSDNITFRTWCTDGTTPVQATVSFNFVYPYYIGANDNSNLNEAGIKSLNKSIIVQNNNHTVSITATNGQYMYYSYPKSYGDLTDIIDTGTGFSIKDSFTRRDVTITGLDGNPIVYSVYEGNSPVAAETYSIRFVR